MHISTPSNLTQTLKIRFISKKKKFQSLSHNDNKKQRRTKEEKKSEKKGKLSHLNFLADLVVILISGYHY
jgi:hypothetical protein